MSTISDSIQAKCLAFSDRIIKLNDYLLNEAANKTYEGKKKTSSNTPHTSYINHHTSSNTPHTSYINHHTSHVPVHMQSVAVLCNQLLRAGTSIGANNAEAISAISSADFKAKSYIALKEAGETDYWLEVIHSAGYFSDDEYSSLDADNKELIRLLAAIVKTSKQGECHWGQVSDIR